MPADNPAFRVRRKTPPQGMIPCGGVRVFPLGRALFHPEAVDADLRVFFARTQYGRGEVVVVGAVGILLRFERQRFAVAQRFAVFAVRFAVEEVAAVERMAGWSVSTSIVRPEAGSQTVAAGSMPSAVLRSRTQLWS